MQFNFDVYKPTAVEKWISSKYKEHGILSPSDLNMNAVAQLFNIDILIYDGPVFAEWEDDVYSFIFLNKDKSEEEQNNDFYHELCHPLRHCGDQQKLPRLFQELQEHQASQFQLVAAMPIYLVRQVPTQIYWERYINDLAYIFNQPIKFVQKRVHQIINNIQSHTYWDQVVKNEVI